MWREPAKTRSSTPTARAKPKTPRRTADRRRRGPHKPLAPRRGASRYAWSEEFQIKDGRCFMHTPWVSGAAESAAPALFDVRDREIDQHVGGAELPVDHGAVADEGARADIAFDQRRQLAQCVPGIDVGFRHTVHRDVKLGMRGHALTVGCTVEMVQI